MEAREMLDEYEECITKILAKIKDPEIREFILFADDIIYAYEDDFSTAMSHMDDCPHCRGYF